MIAYNYRMPNLNAALGCAQLEQLDHFLRLKRMLADRYSEEFRDVRGVQFFGEPDFAKSQLLAEHARFWMKNGPVCVTRS